MFNNSKLNKKTKKGINFFIENVPEERLELSRI